MRIMGLDYGSKTVGVAISDGLLLTAQGTETITRNQENKLRQTLARIKALCEEYDVGRSCWVSKNMNNTVGTGLRNRWNLQRCLRSGQVCLLLCGMNV